LFCFPTIVIHEVMCIILKLLSTSYNVSTKVNTRNGQQHISKQYVSIIFIHGYDYKRTNPKPKIYGLFCHTSHQKEFCSPFFFVSFCHASHRGEFCSPSFSLSMIVTTTIKGNEAPPAFLVFFVTTATTGNEAPPFCFPMYGHCNNPQFLSFPSPQEQLGGASLTLFFVPFVAMARGGVFLIQRFVGAHHKLLLGCSHESTNQFLYFVLKNYSPFCFKNFFIEMNFLTEFF